MFLDNFTTKKIERKDDFLLVEKILNGEERALFEFYRRFRGRMFSYIKKKIENISDSEEILQDTLLSSIDALRDYNGRSSLSTYVFSIASHKIADYYRKKRISQALFSSLPDLGELLSNFTGPEDILDEKLLREKIEMTLGEIKPRYKKVLVFKYVYGMTVAEIADKFSETVKTIESRLFRARREFAKIYNR